MALNDRILFQECPLTIPVKVDAEFGLEHMLIYLEIVCITTYQILYMHRISREH